VALGHFFFPFLSSYSTINVNVYPVFKPNEYFWNTHWVPFEAEQQEEMRAYDAPPESEGQGQGQG